jgi:hypothetical protein
LLSTLWLWWLLHTLWLCWLLSTLWLCWLLHTLWLWWFFFLLHFELSLFLRTIFDILWLRLFRFFGSLGFLQVLILDLQVFFLALKFRSDIKIFFDDCLNRVRWTALVFFPLSILVRFYTSGFSGFQRFSPNECDR